MYYFASDIHLGLGTPEASRAREKKFVRWLEKAGEDADAIFLAGDIFDFWYEYYRVIPKGFTRLFGALSALTDKGVDVHFFAGNHDMWVCDYLKSECGVEIHLKAETYELHGRKVYITHGDEICAGATLTTCFRDKLFRSNVTRWLLSHLMHPNSTIRFGQGWSSRSRKSKAVAHVFAGEDDLMVKFAREYIKEHDVDYFVFGHSHCAEIYPLDDKTTAAFLGEWIEDPVYVSLSERGVIELHRVIE